MIRTPYPATEETNMSRVIGLLAFFLVAGGLLPPSTQASGSIVTGGGMSARDAYVQGKTLTFKKLVCASCPLQAGQLHRERALSLKNSLEARNSETRPGTEDDDHIQVLCPGNRSSNCADATDEQEMVHYFLTRRFKL